MGVVWRNYGVTAGGRCVIVAASNTAEETTLIPGVTPDGRMTKRKVWRKKAEVED